jgi:hypothetical protein
MMTIYRWKKIVKILESFSLIDTPHAFGEKNLSMAVFQSHHSMGVFQRHHSMEGFQCHYSMTINEKLTDLWPISKDHSMGHLTSRTCLGIIKIHFWINIRLGNKYRMICS